MLLMTEQVSTEAGEGADRHRARGGSTSFVMLLTLLACGADDAPPVDTTAAMETKLTVGRDAEIGYPWVAIPSARGGSVWLTDADAKLPVVLDPQLILQRTVGRSGDGPGEFRVPRGLARKGDSVVIVDIARPGLQIFDAEMQYVRTLPFDAIGVAQLVFLRGDTIVTTYPRNDRESFGLPLHVHSPDGAWLRAFGDENRSVDRRFAIRNFRLLTSASESTFWSARYDTLHIEEWTADGRRLRHLTPVIPWLAPLKIGYADRPNQPRHATLIALRTMPDRGLVALLNRPTGVRVPAKVSAPKDGRETNETAVAPDEWLADIAREVESVIVVLDPVTGEVRQEFVVPRILAGGFLSDSSLYGISVGPGGEIRPASARIVIKRD